MVPTVDDEARRSGNIHRLVGGGLAGDLAHRQQRVGQQDQQRARPAGNLDQDDLGGQAARFLST